MTQAKKMKRRAADTVRGARLLDRGLLVGPSWSPWNTAFAAMQGLPLTREQSALVQQCTGRAGFEQAASTWAFVVGRKGGKTEFVAAAAVYLATLKRYAKSPGERLVGMCLAGDRRQAGIVKARISGLLHQLPELVRLIVKETAQTIELANGISIEVHTSSFRSVRGYSCIFAICDEIAFWPSDGPETDTEILAALEPTLLTTGGPLILISTPYAKTGALYALHREHFGQDGPTRIWVAPSLTMNPTLDAAIINRARRKDPAHAAAEYDAQFRADLQDLFDRAALDACVVAGCHERPPTPGTRYYGFVDVASGSDESYACAVCYKDADGRAVVAALREWPSPFDPLSVTAECAAFLRRYGVTTVTGDHYAPGWTTGTFAQHGITYESSVRTKSELLIELVALVNARQVALLDHERALGQLANLQRFTARSGRDSVDHRRGQKDDCANVLAGAVIGAMAASALALLPADFRQCSRALAVPDFDLSSCYIFGDGMFPGGSDPNTCGTCPAHRFAKAAHRAHVAREGGAALDLRSFYRERIDYKSHPFVEKVRHQTWLGQDHGL